MDRSSLSLVWIAAACCAAVLGLWGSLAGADEQGRSDLELQAVLGFADTVTPGRWSPVSVTVSNRGRDLEGHLEVITGHGDALAGTTYHITHRRTLHLTRDSRKRFQFTVLIEGLSQSVQLRVVAGGEVLARRALDLRRRINADALVLVVSRDADLDVLNRRDGGGLRVLYPHPEFLPEHWRGYDAVRAVVLHGISLDGLGERQYEALRRWIASGGTLAVSGGANYSLLRGARMAALLPAVPSGLERIPDPALVGTALGAPLAGTAPIHVNRLPANAHPVLYRAGATPLISARRHGRGRVLFLSFDITRAPFVHWPWMKELWRELLPLSETRARQGRDPRDEEGDVLRAVLDRGTTGFPGHATVLYFLALYLAVLATGYRLRPRNRLARCLIPWMTWASPVLFAPAAYALFGPVLFPKGPTVVATALIEPFADSPYAGVQLRLGLFSNSARILSFHYDGLDPVFQAAPRTASDVTDWTLSDGVPRGVRVDDDRSYVLHSLVGRDVTPFRLQAEVRRTGSGAGSGALLRLRNDSGRRLRGMWLLLDGKGYEIGDVAEDGSLERRFDAGADGVELWPDSPWKVLHGALARPGVEQTITRLLYAQARAGLTDPDSGRPDEAVLLGYSALPLRRVARSEDWRMDGVAMVLHRIAVARPVSLAVNPGSAAPVPGATPEVD